MTLAGLISSITRRFKQVLKNIGKRFSKKKKGKVVESDVVPKSWVKKNPDLESKELPQSTKIVIQQEGKKRLPGLLKIKRLLAGILFLLNFVFSQFLLAASGAQGFFVFLFFLGNSFIVLDYLWKTRRAEK